MYKIFIKVWDKQHYKKRKCSRCGEPVLNSDRCFYRGEYDKKYNFKLVCEDCLTENDYITFNTGYYTNRDSEIFNFLYWRWNIDEMYKFAKENRMKSEPVKTEFLRQWNESGVVTVDESLIDKVDMTKPCIMVNLSQSGSENLIVDGNHRVRRALRDGLERVEFYCFDFKDQFKFLMGDDFVVLKKMVENSLKNK